MTLMEDDRITQWLRPDEITIGAYGALTNLQWMDKKRTQMAEDNILTMIVQRKKDRNLIALYRDNTI